MKRRASWIAVACLLPILGILWGFAPAPLKAPAAASIEPDQLKRMIDGREAFTLINAMSPLECLDRSIAGSLCLPDEVFAAKAPLLLPDKGRHLVFYCESNRCYRSTESAAAAVKQGYARVSILNGGMPAWKGAGYTTVSRDRIPRVPVESVKPDRLAQWIAEKRDVLILDVRREDRFAAGHLPGAVNIPLFSLHERYQEIPLNRTVVVVDDRGLRSFLVSSYLVRKGIADVKRLFGGMERWQAQLGSVDQKAR